MKKIVGKKSHSQKKNNKNKVLTDFSRAKIEDLFGYSVFTTDIKGIIQSWNLGAEKLFGYKEEEVLGKNCSCIFTAEDQKKKVPEKELKNALFKSKTLPERSYVRKNGSQFIGSGIIFPIENEKRIHTGFTKIMRDVSEDKASEQLKDDFISTATHEIKTPITVMKLFTSVVQNKTKKFNSTSLNDSVLGLTNQIDRLITLTNYLLDVSKIQRGNLILEKTSFDINKLITLLVKTMKSTTPHHTLVVHSNIKKRIYADEERIGQVLTNLISNAIKYSPKGGEVIITSTQQTQGIVVSVQDFGLGISRSEQHKLFTRFFRADIARKTNITGIGLGLYIARKIINGHHGIMEMKSVKGVGSTFSFTIPSKEAAISTRAVRSK